MFDRLQRELGSLVSSATKGIRQAQESLPWLLFQLGNDAEILETLKESEAEALGVKGYLGLTRGGVVHSGSCITYLEEIVERLRTKDGWTGEGKLRVVVFKGQYSRNALMSAWGTIYIGEKLLEILSSEAEIAAVLGHEITHFEKVHARLHPSITLDIVAQRIELFKRVSGSPALQMFERLVDGYLEERSQANEYEADRGAVELLARAGYPIEAVETALTKIGKLSEKERRFRERMKRYEYVTPKSALRRKLLEAGAVYSTHPEEAKRLAAVREHIDKVRLEYLQRHELLGWRDWGTGAYRNRVSCAQ